ncbi:lysosomal alpha-N-acetyl glucosaminidase [Salpingoeca rosetta]|uniref:Lysosomal alpha-N-acetyl glucosaminidase n=1 Tax=Salpingoeca rosetta (strain ATCC 50818 / BSB-021) TaxID=946362 RepID=F2U7C1_SALR5|nr:lysosomal alpha-N-acetyl glucosaminidase [Salpingoeca rosetta]EGD83338.1 lysosomal alpha-N-acetyl glucosaminidase [Salpingoeca rosetta]|eukprot:XP_004994842.1 lysosomal alpha-N-acetyl glucosaminidase [Salpingoeca rosetta]
MMMMRVVAVAALVLASVVVGVLGAPPKVSLSAPVHDAVAGAEGVARRVLGEEVALNIVFQEIPPNVADGHDVFEIETVDGQLVIRGNTAVAMSSGLYWYLRYYCNSQVTWGVNDSGRQINVSAQLPVVKPMVRKVNQVRFRYYMNVCTVSYSMAWWNWTRWEKELDWMALHGVNLPLAFTGQEYIWYEFYSSLGLTDSEILDYFTGPAFLAWQRMGNLKYWAAPLDKDWRTSQYNLQLKILSRARELGMVSALPGFAGHVPTAIKRIFPHANLTQTAGWANFNSTYSDVSLLQPTDPLFLQLGTKFYKMLIKAFGTDHVFQMDTYNEMQPSFTNMTLLAESNRVVYQAMANADPEAVYLMQGWLFHESYWTPEHVKVYLSGVPDDKMIILDLNTEANPVFSLTSDYFGKLWIWNMLLNYGGRRGLYGNATDISTRPLLDLHRAQGTMDGIGITPEAIENNPVMFELMLEMGWHATPPDMHDWIAAYASSRYGKRESLTQSAWQLLLEHVYDQPDIDRFHMEMVPDLSSSESRNSNTTALVQAWRLLVTAAVNGSLPITGPFSYDLVDVGRQALLNLWSDVRGMLVAHVKEYNANIDSSPSTAASHVPAIKSLFTLLLDITSDLDRLLGTDVNYLLGVWLESAKATAANADERATREFNARNQITLWGPDGEITDYAAKQWQGLVSDYYVKRWEMMHDATLSALNSSTKIDTSAPKDTLKFEQAWGNENKTYPTAPQADVVKVSAAMLQKYASSSSNYTVSTGFDVPFKDIYQGWTRDVAQLQILCDADPTCVGFNSNGYLKNSLTPSKSSPGTKFYIKNT